MGAYAPLGFAPDPPNSLVFITFFTNTWDFLTFFGTCPPHSPAHDMVDSNLRAYYISLIELACGRAEMGLVVGMVDVEITW